MTISAPVKPTEDPGKVREALWRFFPEAVVTQDGDDAKQVRLVASGGDLRPLRKRVWELRIIDTVRGQVLRGAAADGRSLRFLLSKQAALAGKVSFPPTPHALGDLEVQVQLEASDPWKDAEAVAMWLCPETKDGEIVGPIGD